MDMCSIRAAHGVLLMLMVYLSCVECFVKFAPLCLLGCRSGTEHLAPSSTVAHRIRSSGFRLHDVSRPVHQVSRCCGRVSKLCPGCPRRGAASTAPVYTDNVPGPAHASLVMTEATSTEVDRGSWRTLLKSTARHTVGVLAALTIGFFAIIRTEGTHQ